MDFDKEEINELTKLLSNVPDERERLKRIWTEYREKALSNVAKFRKEKNEADAEVLKTYGNMHYSSKRYREALKHYNQALCKTPKNSLLLGTLYANRSAVYLVIKRPFECFENLKLALENGYPKEKRVKLEERRLKCMKMINEMPEDEIRIDAKPILTPALSHPVHAKFPFLSNAVDVVLDQAAGPQLLAKENLQVGDTFFIDPFQIRAINAEQNVDYPSDCFIRCAFCLLPVFLSLIPCSQCDKVMFCKDCFPKFRRIHRMECHLKHIDSRGPLVIRSAIKIFGLYNYDLEQLKQDIAECQSNPESILEGNYVTDLERQVIRWIFPRWDQLDLTIWVGKSIYAAIHLRLLLLNSTFKTLINSLDKEITILQIIFSLTNTAIYSVPNGFMFKPIRAKFFTEDNFEFNARNHSGATSNFTYCLRPVKCHDTIKIASHKALFETFENHEMTIFAKAIAEGDERMVYELLQKHVSEFHKTSKGLEFPNFNAAVELKQIAKGDQSAKLRSRERLAHILNEYDRHFPCLEWAVVMWLYRMTLNQLYYDKDYILMSKMEL